MINTVEITFDFRSLIQNEDLLSQETENVIKQLANLDSVNEVERVRDSNLPDGAMGSGKFIRGLVRAVLSLVDIEPYLVIVHELLKIYYDDSDKGNGIYIDINFGGVDEASKIEFNVRSEEDLNHLIDEVKRRLQILPSDDENDNIS